MLGHDPVWLIWILFYSGYYITQLISDSIQMFMLCWHVECRRMFLFLLTWPLFRFHLAVAQKFHNSYILILAIRTGGQENVITISIITLYLSHWGVNLHQILSRHTSTCVYFIQRIKHHRLIHASVNLFLTMDCTLDFHKNMQLRISKLILLAASNLCRKF